MEGYVYCFSNESMEKYLKIGFTEKTPEERLKDANSSGTWKPPLPYKIELAKKVKNPRGKEKTLHKLLSQYCGRPNSSREFFEVSIEEVKTFFKLMDGEDWEEKEPVEDCVSIVIDGTGCRDISKCIKNGQKVRHVIGITEIWEGIYNTGKNCIVMTDREFSGRSPLNQFVSSHYKEKRPQRGFSANAWSESETLVEGKWISTYNLPEF